MRLIFTQFAGWGFSAGKITNHVPAFIHESANSRHEELSDKKQQFCSKT
jgi:hypothetical protein